MSKNKQKIIKKDGETYVKLDTAGLNAKAKELKRKIGIREAEIKLATKDIADWTEELNEILDAGGIIDEDTNKK